MKVVITGASGALGGALALAYAAPGRQLVLQGRNVAQLEALAERCRSLGATVEQVAFDLTDLPQTLAWCRELVAAGVPDTLYANAGMNINTGSERDGEHWDEMSQLIDLNIKSTLALAHHMGLAMRERGHGQIVLLSSLAGYYGLSLTPTYSASKAAVKAYGEGLRGWLESAGVGVTVVMPGYVSSAMCDAMPGPKPFLWSPERAAAVITRGVARNRARITFPFPLDLGCWALALLPSGVSQRILKWLGYSD